MSGWFSFGGCDEKEKRKTTMFEFALKSVEKRRETVLAEHPTASIHVYKTWNSVEFIAWDATGQNKIARDFYIIG